MRKKNWTKEKLDAFFEDGNMAIELVEEGFPFTKEETERINKELNDEEEEMSDSDLCDMIEEIAYKHFDKTIYTALAHDEGCDNEITPLGSYNAKEDAIFAVIDHMGVEHWDTKAKDIYNGLEIDGYYSNAEESYATYYVVENILSCR